MKRLIFAFVTFLAVASATFSQEEGLTPPDSASAAGQLTIVDPPKPPQVDGHDTEVRDKPPVVHYESEAGWKSREEIERAVDRREKNCEKPPRVDHVYHHQNSTKTVYYQPKGLATTKQVEELRKEMGKGFDQVNGQFKTVNKKLDAIDGKVGRLPTREGLAKALMNPDSIKGPPKKGGPETVVEQPWLWVSFAILIGAAIFAAISLPR